ncbi:MULTISPECIES: PAQR family membrane homeostasis protein TrhA [unclassified Arthrobacter]|uniref:PAQR family membrane homeostasis protein TrhA n=1 Tax=unclassified Arthrobacter TaxID=235627 RepID=UPI001D15AD0E|nr:MULTISPECIES: hemolysin III family protein [unclassified Arthrobacter]MCC3277176.1 hemolysin III family protein [Arthrobacter sp. zg-Y20]MCC3280118.1 hemolysin III family protein [Arthrobacter sp. zg-Y40]MCC9179078.1 hemolysin III family protein [Arthrobacter sp. zg-Y750]MDK1317337.1 hemolysin III family protein [Arthrobacter sp. zg.Y20]MDK1328530.1 hemolysin III family protein [Arthrobacter sp. zg-Y1143]
MDSSSSSARPHGVPAQHDPDSRVAPGPLESVVESLAEELEVKPRLRGWFHAGAAPLALAAGIVLVILSPTTGTRIASAVYAFTGVLLFGVSAVYHRGNWSPKVKKVLKRLDHTNIMLVIAGSYTPLAWALLPRGSATTLLWLIWAGALVGVAFRLLWLNAPRWLYTPVYIALGCAALFYIPDFYRASPAAAWLICVGGAMYIAGAVIYAMKRPNPSVEWFGFHEIFHAFTLAGFACHYVAIMSAVLGAGH